jgi:hypothetical protein
MLFVALFVLSCGKSNPITSGVDSPEHFVMGFQQTPVAVFSGNYDYLDADAATIMNGFGTEVPDTVWEDDEGHNWAVATALEYDGSETHILYRFLGDDEYMGTMSAMFTIDDLPVKIRFPRVASSFFDVSTDFVEVAIAYQYWDLGGNDWDIGVVRIGFDPAVFDVDHPEYIEPEWTAAPEGVDTVFSEIHPDLAYTPETGDLWLVYSKNVDEGIWHIYVLPGMRDDQDKTVVEWNSNYEQIAQNTSGLEAHNGFHPRIDIGFIKLPGYSPPAQWMLVIAYTGGHQPGEAVHSRWHVRVNYWPVFDLIATPFTNNWYVRDWEFGDYPGGVPMIDVGPKGSDFGALVWTQAKTDDWSNCTLSYVDSRGGRHHQTPDSEWGSMCTAFPSVAVHQWESGTDYYASVSFLRSQNYVNEYWNPRAVLLTTDTTELWPDKTSAANSLTVSSTIHGTWDPGGIVEHYLGLSTALTVMDDKFWVIWSGYDEGAGPDTVYGSFGSTAP